MHKVMSKPTSLKFHTCLKTDHSRHSVRNWTAVWQSDTRANTGTHTHNHTRTHKTYANDWRMNAHWDHQGPMLPITIMYWEWGGLDGYSSP